jgi:hypothetical protein
VAGRRMAQPVYPQLRKYPYVPALTLRAKNGSVEDAVKQHRNFRMSARLGQPWGHAISSRGDMPKYRVTHFCEALLHVPVYR